MNYYILNDFLARAILHCTNPVVRSTVIVSAISFVVRMRHQNTGAAILQLKYLTLKYFFIFSFFLFVLKIDVRVTRLD